MKDAAHSHPKMRRLALALRPHLLNSPIDPQTAATGLLERLWYYTSKQHRTGVLSGVDSVLLSSEIGWYGDSDSLLSALVSCGWIDSVDGVLHVHDWSHHCPNWVKGVATENSGRFTKKTDLVHGPSPQPSPQASPGLEDGPPKAQDLKPKAQDLEPKQSIAVAFVIPEWINKETWDGFMEVRKRCKAANTPFALKQLVAKIEEYSGKSPEKAKAVMNQSIENSWKGAFPLKDSVNRPQFSNTIASSMNGKNSDGTAVDYWSTHK